MDLKTDCFVMKKFFPNSMEDCLERPLQGDIESGQVLHQACSTTSSEDSDDLPRILTAPTYKWNFRPVRHVRLDAEDQLDKFYCRGRFLGKGTFGIVIQAIHIATDTTWAIKIINRDQAEGNNKMRMLNREISILKLVNHPHIIFLKEVFETSQKVFLVMEYCPQVLKDVLKAEGHFAENVTRLIMKRLISAISYLHKNGIAHRDLKIENILIGRNPDDETDRFYIKVTDFSLSAMKMGPGCENMFIMVCGTPTYMAPEIIELKKYSQQCDIWAIGIIMHIMIIGTPPFQGETQEELFANITANCLNFNHAYWEEYEDGAKILLEGMLRIDPAYRLTANEILQHPWIMGQKTESNGMPETVIDLMHKWKDELQVSPPENAAPIEADKAESAPRCESTGAKQTARRSTSKKELKASRLKRKM